MLIQQLRAQGVELGVLRAPGLGVGHAHGEALVSDLACQALLPVPDGKAHQPVFPDKRKLRLEPVKARGEDIEVFDILPLPHVEPDLAVEPAVGQIVDHEAEGRHRGVLRAVKLYTDAVFPAIAYRVRDLRAKGGVAAAVLAELFAVDKDLRDMRRAVKLQEKPLAAVFLRDVQRAAIAVDALVVLGACVMKRRLSDAVGQAHGHGLSAARQQLLRPVFGKLPGATKIDHVVFLRYIESCAAYSAQYIVMIVSYSSTEAQDAIVCFTLLFLKGL